MSAPESSCIMHHTSDSPTMCRTASSSAKDPATPLMADRAPTRNVVMQQPRLWGLARA